MESNKIVARLNELKNTTKDPATKKVVSGILQVIEASEVDGKAISGMINESLKKLEKKDTEVANYFNYSRRKTVLENLGVRTVIAKLKTSKLYETSEDAQGFTQSYEEFLQTHPEYHIAEQFVTGIKRFAWNNVIKAPLQVLESNMHKNKVYRMLQEAIDAIAYDGNADLYAEAINKLDRAFSLPENMIRSYVLETFRNKLDQHPVITKLIEQMYLISPDKLNHTTYIQTRMGRHKVFERVSPVLFDKENNRELFMLNNRLYEVKYLKEDEAAPASKGYTANWTNTESPKTENVDATFFTAENGYGVDDIGKITQLKAGEIWTSPTGDHTVTKDADAATESKKKRKSTVSLVENLHTANIPKKFLNICEAFSMFRVDDKKLKISDSVYEYAIKESTSKDAKFILEVDGQEQQGTPQDAMTDLATMGTDNNLLAALDVVGNNLDSIVVMDNIIGIIPDGSGVTIDIIKTDGTLHINIFDNSTGVTEFMPDADPAAQQAVQNNYGVDVGAVVTEAEPAPPVDPAIAAKEAEEKAKKEEELKNMTEQLEEITENLEKIELLDEDQREDEKVVGLKAQLVEKQKALSEQVQSMREELGIEEEEVETASQVTGGDTDAVETICNDISELKGKVELGSVTAGAIEPSTETGTPVELGNGITVTPVIDIESDGNKANVVAVYLKMDGDISALQGSDFNVVDENTVMLASTFETSANVPDELKTEISSVINALMGSPAPKSEEDEMASPAAAPAEA